MVWHYLKQPSTTGLVSWSLLLYLKGSAHRLCHREYCSRLCFDIGVKVAEIRTQVMIAVEFFRTAGMPSYA